MVDNAEYLNKKRNSSNNVDSSSKLKNIVDDKQHNEVLEEKEAIKIEKVIFSILRKIKQLAECKQLKEKKIIIDDIMNIIGQYLPNELEREFYVHDGKIIHPFNTPMSLQEFLILLCCAVEMRIKNFFDSHYGEELIIKRRLFSFVRTNIFNKTDIISDDLLGDIKKDFFLGLFTYEQSDFQLDMSFFSYNLADIQDYFSLENDHDNYYKDNDIFPNSPSSEPLSIFNRNHLKEILTSTPIIEIYKEVLSIQGFKEITNNDIKMTIENFIEHMKIYLIVTINYGFTIFNGVIFLRQEMVKGALVSYGQVGCTVLTIIHEIGHCLKRLMLEDTNYYLNTEPMVYNKDKLIILEKQGLKENNINKTRPKLTDFGTAVEYIMYKNDFLANKIGINAGKFLLQRTSYALSKSDFCSHLVKALKDDDILTEGTYPLGRSSNSNLPIICNRSPY